MNLGVSWLNIVKSQFDKIKEQQELITSQMILIEQFMSLIRLLQHLHEDQIDFDDILQSKINEDQNIYIELIETNLNAITLNE